MIEAVVRENLRKIVAAVRAATGEKTSQVSRRCYGNAAFLDAFFAGEQSISLSKLDALLKSIAADWPEGAEWPFCRAIILRSPRRSR